MSSPITQIVYTDAVSWILVEPGAVYILAAALSRLLEVIPMWGALYRTTRQRTVLILCVILVILLRRSVAPLNLLVQFPDVYKIIVDFSVAWVATQTTYASIKSNKMRLTDPAR